MNEIFEKFVPCGNCHDGYLYDRYSSYVKRCSCYTQYLEKQELRLQIFKAGLSPAIIDYDIESYIGTKSLPEVEKIKFFIKNFKSKFYTKQLYLYGTNGTQKTTLAHYIGRELLKQHMSVRYTLMNEMVKNLTKEGFEEDVQKEIDIYHNVDCLIVDEAFDKEKLLWYKSNYQMNFLDSLLRKRIDQLNKCTIFISNKDVESLNENFNKSIYDLIKRNTQQTVLEFKDHYSIKDNFEPEDLWTR